jgi:rubrerythrin
MLLAKTLLLESEPAGTVHSLDELFALAHAMELEAATRYTDLAEEMRRQGKDGLAEVFADLAAAEREHVDSVTRWSQSRRHKAPDPALVRWDIPETLDAEAAAEIKASRLMTPYRALAMAVRNEERAFAFWAYLSAYSKDAEIKKAAETMAQEELGHVATLRKERRRAYHREHNEVRGGRQGGAAAGQIDAGELERRLAVLVAEQERAHTGAVANRAHELLMETTEMAAEAAGVGRFPAALAQGDAEQIAETLVDAYLESAETASEPAHLDKLQGLAGRAIARLAWLRSLNVKSP